MGIDQEDIRPLRTGIGRFFLHPDEAAVAGNEDLVRVWTVKEALFKSTPGSAPLLSDLRMGDVTAINGTARCVGRPELSYLYSTTRSSGGYTTVAVSTMRSDDE